MSRYTKQEFLQKINESDINDDLKADIVAKIESSDEVTDELVAWVKEQIQAVIDETFAKAGVVDDESDPEYQKQHQAMMNEIDAAEAEFAADMDGINKEAAAVEEEAGRELDDVQAQAVKSSIQDM